MSQLMHKVFKRHKPVDGETKFNGQYYISICKYCYKPVMLTGNTFSLIDKWVIDENRLPIRRVYDDPDM